MLGDPEDGGIFSGWSQQLNTFYLQQLQQLALDTFGVCASCVIAYMLLFVHVSFMSLFVNAQEVCMRAFVSYSMHVLDRWCGFAIVLISLCIG